MKYKILLSILALPIFAAEKTGQIITYLSSVKTVLDAAKKNLIATKEFNSEPFINLADELIKNKPRIAGLNNFSQNPLVEILDLYATFIENNPSLKSLIESAHKNFRFYVIPRTPTERNIRERAAIFFIYLFIETQLLPELLKAQQDQTGRVIEEPHIKKEALPTPQIKTDYYTTVKNYLGYLRNYFTKK